MLGLIDPTGSGLVASLARPGGNITGQAVTDPGIGRQAFAVTYRIAAGAKRVRVLFYPADPIDAPQIRELKQAAGTLGLTLQLRFGRAEDFPSAFEDQGSEPAQALLTSAESIFLSSAPASSNWRCSTGCLLSTRISLRARRRPDGLFPKSFRNTTGSRPPDGSHLERRQTGRTAGRAAVEIRLPDQPEGRQGRSVSPCRNRYSPAPTKSSNDRVDGPLAASRCQNGGLRNTPSRGAIHGRD
jgi:hypothetical protein